MASVWDWLPGPSGLWDYLSQYPERYRDQILQGLMQYSERPGALSAGPLVTSFNPLGPFAEDVTAQAAPLVEPLAQQQNRMYEALTGEEGQLRGEHIAGPLIGSVFRGRLPDVGKTGFFSPTSRALAKAQPKGTGKQYVAAVKKEPGATAEATQGGLIELLEDAPGTMTREQALSMWNPLELTETVKGEMDINMDSPFALPEVVDVLRNATATEGDIELNLANDYAAYQALSGSFPELLEKDDWAEIVVNDVFGGGTKPSSAAEHASNPKLNLPGGTNPKEILVQLPTPKLADFDSREAYNAAIRAQDQRGGLYEGGHYAEPNVLVHIRTNERDVGGKKALHIEEIQSDWHQQGQKEGYQKGAEPVTWEFAAMDLGYEPTQRNLFSEVELTEIDQHYEFLQSDFSPAQIQPKGVPDAPFKKNWHELAFKRALTEAINDPTIERLTWTTGAVQADRYNLAKYIDSIEAQWSRQPTSFNDEVPYDLAIINKDGESEYLRDIPRDELENYVGKEMAQKIIDDADGDVETYSGLDLEVGGEFHKNLYDKKITQFAKKFLKKYGVEPQRISGRVPIREDIHVVSDVEVELDELSTEYNRFYDEHREAINDRSSWESKYLDDLNEKIEALESQAYDRNYWYIDITPEMREEIMTQGVPLTQRRKQMGLMAGYA